jgi:hypothetical protein
MIRTLRSLAAIQNGFYEQEKTCGCWHENKEKYSLLHRGTEHLI